MTWPGMRRRALLVLSAALLALGLMVPAASAAAKPVVVTGAASAVTALQATLNGTVNPKGQATNAWFQWGTTTAYGHTTAQQAVGSGSAAVPVSQAITGLSPAATYHFRIVAQNVSGTSRGADATFTTAATIVTPVVVTGAATGVTGTSATLNGTVNPEGAATSYHFEYGTTTAYGTSVPVPDGPAGSGTSDVPVSVAISGLAPSTAYHYRLVASNADAGAAGLDAMFTTSAGGGTGFVTRSGAQLMLNGSPYRFVGLDAYGLATCDGLTYSAADLDAFFASLQPNSVVRFWATQKATTAQIDLVIARAQADGVKVNPTLIDGPNNCNASGQTVDANFVAQTGTTWASYLSWIDTVITPFAPGGSQAANAPAVAFWGICNECDSYANTPAQMQAMNETAAARIKADDPSNLVSAGTAGNKSASCNQAGTNFQVCESAPDLDVMEIHEYQYDQTGNTGVHTSWDGVYKPASVANARPLIVGETGANVSIPSNNLCHTTPDTTIDQLAQQKYTAYMGDSAAGVMVWNWMKSQPSWVGNGCVGQDFFFGPGNAVNTVEKNFVIP
jgi:Cellulase (glycosyl hydrolase family 5)